MRTTTQTHNERVCPHESDRRQYAGSGAWFCNACGRFPMSAPQHIRPDESAD